MAEGVRSGGPDPIEPKGAADAHPKDGELGTLQEKTTEAAADFFFEEVKGKGGTVRQRRMSTGGPETGDLGVDVMPLSAGRAPSDRIGLMPDDYAPFVAAAIETQTPSYLESLDEGAREDFHTLSPNEQQGRVQAWLTDPERARHNERPRLELRACPQDPARLANVALCCASPDAREELFAELEGRGVARGLNLVQAGSTTIEIASAGVDKATPIKYLQQEGVFTSVLDKIGYRPGPHLNARETPTVVVADADGTIWGKPEAGGSPETNGLLNSPARDSILGYIRAGGVLVINTGNDPARTAQRFLPGIAGLPSEEQREILSRVVICSGGGGSMAGFIDGEFKEFNEYHSFDPETPGRENALDMVYIGDDPKLLGNDMPAFRASDGRFILVAEGGSEAHIEESSRVEPQIKDRVQLGEVASTHAIFSALTIQARLNRAAVGADGPTPPLFEDMEALLANTRNIIPAGKIVESTLERLGGRRGLDDRVIETDRLNPPGTFTSEDTVAAMEALPAPDEGETRDFATIEGRIRRMGEAGAGPVRHELDVTEADRAEEVSEARAMVRSFVRSTDIVSQSEEGPVSVRILEPGNNDQATPAFIAQQIRMLREEVEASGGRVENLRIQVLVMGKGGHATTALFPQIGQMREREFSGTEEAVSLGGTLQRALEEAEIPVQVVDSFADAPETEDSICVKLEKDSTNTGENVRNALGSYEADRPNYQWVVSARTQSLRQALTFAHQYQREGGEKAYDRLWSMPLPRGEGFVRRHLSDFQATTEFYAGMAENARLISYALKPGPYIPPFTRDPGEFMRLVDSVYASYAEIRGISREEANATSIEDIQKFFGSRFSTLEQAIPWSKRAEHQEGFTRASIRAIAKEGDAKTVAEAHALLGQYEARGVSDARINRAVHLFLAQARGATQRELVTLARRVINCFRTVYPEGLGEGE